MSRHFHTVEATQAVAAFAKVGIDVSELVVVVGTGDAIELAHGYDRPCTSYFCDVEPDCEVGAYYGGIGLTRRLTKWDYVELLKDLGLEYRAGQVALDLPY